MQKLGYILWFGIVFCSCKQKNESNKETDLKKISQITTCGPEVSDKLWYSSGKKAPILSGLDGLNFPVSTKNAEVQKYFNQGLMLSFGFNHAEAGRSFYEVTRIDSTCAMGWWGFAYVLGPNYNGGMEPDNFKRAYDAAQKAKSLSAKATQKEQDLIEALTHRYTSDSTITRSSLDLLFANAMRKVYKKHPEDATIASLFAESLMDLHPWNLYKKDGNIQPWTPEILALLEKGLRKNPKHAGLNHFYIHAVEMSPHAEKAVASADLLMDLVPGSGHLVHMPSHTYLRIGRYHDGVLSNQKAVLVDSLYTEACHAQGVYPLAYYPHNYHFMAACATIGGETKNALKGAKATAAHANIKLFQEPGWGTLQHYFTIPWYVEVKLGLWNEIRNSPAPEKELKYPTVIWNYAQGMAHLSQNKTAEAKKHLAEMKTIMKDTTIKALTIWDINTVFDLCEIATKTLEGEINAKEKKYDKAILLIQEAIKIEDALNYNEPPDWFFSVRHHLGAILIDAGKIQEAQKVYEKDLVNFPKNGWALKGLMNAYEKIGNTVKYNDTKKQFDEAWKHADNKISSSRIW